MRNLWGVCGYADAQDRTPYHRGPYGQGIEPPAVPDSDLPANWRDYLDGFRAGVNDGTRTIMRKARRA